MSKIKVAYGILTSCTGCKISFLDIHEKILNVLENVELVYSHMIMDYRTVPEDIDLLFLEGSVATVEDLEEAKELRKKAKYVVAVGACACFGGIPGMRNFFANDQILTETYASSKNGNGFMGPSKLLPKVKTLPSVIDVDFQLPGCPPLPENFLQVIEHFPNFDQIELPTKTLCDQCDLQKKKLLDSVREFTSLKILSPYELEDEDEDLCFLERGALCMGIATRSGCGGRCVSVGVPCRGCFGPPIGEGSEDQGAGFISAISSILPTGRLLHKEDILGLVYRYSLSVISNIQENDIKEGRND